MEYALASTLAIALGIVAVSWPKFYAERVFKPIYYVVLAGLAVGLATVYLREGVVSNHLIYAFAGLGLVSVALLPLAGKLSGRW